jgi:hypothetical protein
MGVVMVEAPGIAPVPEPGTFGMLLAGATGLFFVKRRNRSTRQQKTRISARCASVTPH